MKVEKSGGRTENTKMLTIQCTTCGMDMEHFDPENETLARDCYLQGATSMLGLLISAGMPPEFLDGLAEGIRGAKRGMGEGK